MTKIIAGDFRTKYKRTLPMSKVEVEFYATLMVGELKNEDLKLLEKGGMKNGIRQLKKLIISWNMYGSKDDEQTLPISEESFDKLPASDLGYLMDEILKIIGEQKKSSVNS